MASKSRDDVLTIASKHNPDSHASLIDYLSNVPDEAWESEFEILDMSLCDSIRIQLLGAGL